MSNYAVVVLLPDNPTDPSRADFCSREFDQLTDLAPLLTDLEKQMPGWQLITVCRIELLPKLMDGPPA